MIKESYKILNTPRRYVVKHIVKHSKCAWSQLKPPSPNPRLRRKWNIHSCTIAMDHTHMTLQNCVGKYVQNAEMTLYLITHLGHLETQPQGI